MTWKSLFDDEQRTCNNEPWNWKKSVQERRNCYWVHNIVYALGILETYIIDVHVDLERAKNEAEAAASSKQEFLANMSHGENIYMYTGYSIL